MNDLDLPPAVPLLNHAIVQALVDFQLASGVVLDYDQTELLVIKVAELVKLAYDLCNGK
jgi:hypothetical protein